MAFYIIEICFFFCIMSQKQMSFRMSLVTEIVSSVSYAVGDPETLNSTICGHISCNQGCVWLRDDLRIHL